jgi:hypothetical protein
MDRMGELYLRKQGLRKRSRLRHWRNRYPDYPAILLIFFRGCGGFVPRLCGFYLCGGYISSLEKKTHG